MNKKEFMIQYVLNRAGTNLPTGLDGVGSAKMAEKIWEYIELKTKESNGTN